MAFNNKGYVNANAKLVEVQPLALQTIKASILASGQLKHELEVKLSAEVIGKVSKLFVEEGDKVSKGQLLLTIDDKNYVAAVEQQKAVVDQQRIAIERQKLVVDNFSKQLKRSTELFNENLIGQEEFDNVFHQHQISEVDLKSAHEMLKQAESSLEQQRDLLSKTKVLSPINGTVTSLDIKEGETAISSSTNIIGSSLMTIADPLSMVAEINVDEADIADISVGQKAEIIAIAFAEQPLSGTVESIASSAKIAKGRQSLSFAVKLKLYSNLSVKLQPGMSCRAEVFTQQAQAMLAIPIRSVRTAQDVENDLIDNFVFVVKDGVAKKASITTGIADDSYQHVVEGLKQGALIITGPNKILRHLKDGDRVSIAQQ